MIGPTKGDPRRAAERGLDRRAAAETVVVEKPEKEMAPAMPGGGGMGDRY